MSVVVRMEKPQNCYNCDLRYECNAFYASGKPKPFMKGCLILCQLPEGHGRLVDADAVESIIRKWFEEIKLNPDILLDGVKSLPTIVLEERSET